MRLSISSACLYVYPLRKTFELVKRAGFDGIELVIGPELEWRGGVYARRLSSEYQLPILTVHPPLFGFPGWRKVHLSIAPYLQRALSLTRAVGAPMLIVHMPRARRLDDPIGSRFLHGLVSAKEEMNGTGPKLSLENTSKFRKRDANYVLNSLAELRAFADQYDFQMTLDTAHVGTWDLDILESLKYFDGRLANVHLSDLAEVPDWVLRQPRLHSYVRQHQLPGAGRLPLREFLRALKDRHYEGPVTYEISPLALKLWSSRQVEGRLRRLVEFVQQAIR